jgi:hypothetical protein
MSDADRIKVSYVAETTWGTTPTSPTLQDVRLTGEAISMETSTEDSAEIRPDRQKSDTIRTAIQAGGDLNFEMSYGTYDDFMKAALFASDWSSQVTDVSSDVGVAAVASGNKYTGDDEEFANYGVGEWVWVEGFSDNANNGLRKIVAINSSNPGVAENDELVVVGGTLVDETAGDTVSITQLSSITNGTTQHSFTIEKYYTDLTTTYVSYTGMVINSFSLSLALESVISGTFNFMGKEEAWGTSTVGDGSNTSPTSTKVMNTVDHIEFVYEDDTSFEATEITLELQNNLRARGLLGQLAKDSVGNGLCNVTGTLKAYFESSTTMEKYSNYSSTAIAVVLKDTAGNRYVLDMPEVKLTNGTAVAGGQSQDIIAEFEFSAIMDPSENKTIRIARLPAA